MLLGLELKKNLQSCFTRLAKQTAQLRRTADGFYKWLQQQVSSLA